MQPHAPSLRARVPRRGLDEWTRERVDFVTDDEIFNGGYFLAHFDAALFVPMQGEQAHPLRGSCILRV